MRGIARITRITVATRIRRERKRVFASGATRTGDGGELAGGTLGGGFEVEGFSVTGAPCSDSPAFAGLEFSEDIDFRDTIYRRN